MNFACCKSTTGGAGDAIHCSQCKSNYHLKCLYPTTEKRPDPALRKNWTCPECIMSQPRQLNKDNTPIRSNPSNVNKASYNDNITVRRGASTSCSPLKQDLPHAVAENVSDDCAARRFEFGADEIRNIIAAEINRLATELRTTISNELKTIKDDISSIKDSMNFINNKYEELNTRVDKIEKDFKSLKTSCSDVVQLKSTVDSMENEISDREQWARRSNVEIYGIPERKNENLIDLLNSISVTSNFDLIVPGTLIL